MKRFLAIVALLVGLSWTLCAQTHSNEKYRPTGIKDILMLDGDMEYSMQGTVVEAPKPRNRNNDYLSIAGVEIPQMPQTESRVIYYPTLYIRNTLLDKASPIDLDEIIYNGKVLKVDRPPFNDCYVTDVTAFNDLLFFVAKTNGYWFTLFFDTKTYDVDCISQSSLRKGVSTDKRWLVTYEDEDVTNDKELSRESLGKLYDFIKSEHH